MKRKLPQIIAAATLLSIISGCGNNNQTTSQTTTSTPSATINTTTSVAPIVLPEVTLDNFKVIYNGSAINDVYRTISALNTTINNTFGYRLNLATYPGAQESDFEIIIGNINREDVGNLYLSLGKEDIIIKAVATETSVKIYVGGLDDAHTIFAINELKKAFLDGVLVNHATKIVNAEISIAKDCSKIFIPNEDLDLYTIVYESTLDDNVKYAINFLYNDIKKASGSTLIKLKEASYGDDLSDITHGLFIGNFTDKSETIKDSIGMDSYVIRGDYRSDSTIYYLVGTSNQEVLNAIQYLYRESVVNGKLNIREYNYVTVNSILHRDPCIVPYEGVYYMYCGTDNGYAVRSSTDLLNWGNYKEIFNATKVPGFTGIGDYWAPEVHYYQGGFYLFATYRSSTNNHRGCSIFYSPTPDGEFQEITNGHITPNDWDAIDGTLYVNQQGVPYMVFVHEWTSTEDGNGTMAYAQLSDDLSTFVTEPVEIFKSTDPVWADEPVTDGCYMHRLSNGELIMIWSNFAQEDFTEYTIGIAKSSNGDITGDWIQQDDPLYWNDDSNVYEVVNGGHGMIFRSFEGRLYLALHTPNAYFDDYKSKFIYIPIVEDLENNTIKLDLVY